MSANVALAPLAAAAILLLGGAGCDDSSDGFAQPSHGSSPSQPFVADGGIEAGDGSGLWGDTTSGPDGMHLGCLAGRRYALAVTMQNRSKNAVTLTGVRGAEPAPGVIRRVAVQLRLAPPPDENFPPHNLGPWSTMPAAPVTVPPGRSAVVQSNFLMRDCDALALNGTLVVGGALVLSYRGAGRAGRQEVAQPSARIILSPGPTIRSCGRVPGATGVFAYDIGCDLARRAAIRCDPAGSGATCSAAGHDWSCTSSAREPVQRCWLASKRQSFKVHWGAS